MIAELREARERLAAAEKVVVAALWARDNATEQPLKAVNRLEAALVAWNRAKETT